MKLIMSIKFKIVISNLSIFSSSVSNLLRSLIYIIKIIKGNKKKLSKSNDCSYEL